ncbi:flagellar basal-body rod protein FlgF [Bacillus fonticola]|uniref:flagellar basal-body rod protein FlgF n=1 Tax=Bacillus fonticola TaxID=2728853 RepID=UPI001475AAA0|nr:flagellar basal-body rod protein FlgF [Bacillus fonticola]
MLRSMYSGISGLKNFQTKLDVIGNNIANVNTFGFKKGRVTFKDAMNQSIQGATAAQGDQGGRNPVQVGLGSTVGSIDTIDTQGSLQTTGRPLDLAIDGDGYFIVRNGDNSYYTRAGNFYLDDNGTLVNSDGYKVQSFANGLLEDIEVNVNSAEPARVTENMTFAGNLPPNSVGNKAITQQMKVVNDNGEDVTLDVEFAPGEATGEWDVSISNPSNPEADPVTRTITFAEDPDNEGLLVAEELDALDLEELAGITGGVNLDVTGLAQNEGSITALVAPDGNTEGNLQSFNIGASGEINGVYSNGLVSELGQIALAKFSNPSGLEKTGNNLYRASVNSGDANVGLPGVGRGGIASSALEMSNVDLSEEFTEMITAQRGFQANTRIITTSDEVLQELVNLKR